MKDDFISRIAARVAAGPNVLKEGALGAPIGQVIAHLQHFLSAKYAINLSYLNFADRVKGPWRDSLVDHWHVHAKEELESAYQLSMKIVALGGDPIQTTINIPQCVASVEAFCKVLMDQELDALEAGRKLMTLAGPNTGLKVLAENTVILDSEHLSDLHRMSSTIVI